MPDHFTTRLQLPYPDIDDPADVPADLQQLAERLDVVVGGSGASGGGTGLPSLSVLDVGMAGQIRAGRQLTAQDFTRMGLNAPLGLWNLSDVSDASGNGRALTNKGALTFVPGINGAAATAVQFTGSTAQVLYISDVGANDPFRIKTGSWGCWFRTGKRSTVQYLVGKLNVGATDRAFALYVDPGSNTVSATLATVPGTWAGQLYGATESVDDRWHHGVATYDGAVFRLYVDGVLEAQAAVTGTINPSAGPLNIGGQGGDAATVPGGTPYGRIDEAFVTSDVLSDDQVRLLYAAKIAHGASFTPSGVRVNVHRRRRGAVLVAGDFPTPPLRLYNFTDPAPFADEGSNGALLTYNNGPVQCAGADGKALGAWHYVGSGSLSATDAGLPAALASRSYGAWFKLSAIPGAAVGILAWGTVSTNDCRLWVYSDGGLYSQNGGDTMGGRYVCDGLWHHAVAVEDNAAGDGLKRRLYLDGRLMGSSTALVSVTLAGANRFRVGAAADGTQALTGQVDAAFVCGYSLTREQVLALYHKGAQDLGVSPKEAGEHVELVDATSVLFIGDGIDGQHTVDLGVIA